jgi:hypothetical protein
MMKLRSGVLAGLLGIMTLIIAVAGCAGHKAVEPPPPPPVMAQPPPPPPPIPTGGRPDNTVSYHVWGALLSYGMEQKEYPGYAVYTYVLFNSNQSDAGSPEGKRYDGILRAVLQDVKTQETGAAAGWLKNETNIFCIPFMIRSPKKADALGKYNFDLSQKYLAVLQVAVKSNKDLFKRLEQRPGPFLISLYEPLPGLKGKAATRMLYLDLTDMPVDGMRQVLDAYKERLNAEPLKNVEKLRESLKITLMKYALKLDENLKIVDVAFARFK